MSIMQHVTVKDISLVYLKKHKTSNYSTLKL